MHQCNKMDNLKWKILSSEYLYKATWFTIRKDVCETPEHKIIDPYYVYEFPTWVSAVALTEANEVVMIRQYRHALGESIMEIPGGCVDDTDASLEAAVQRELLEETGYSFSKYEYLGKISPNPSTNDNLMHMYVATGGKKVREQELDHNEEIEVHLLSIHEVKILLKENKIMQALHATCLFYAFDKLGLLDY